MSDLLFEDIEDINKLYDQGLYIRALRVLQDFEQKPDFTVEDQINCHILKSNILHDIGRNLDALKFIENACNLSQELGNKQLQLDSYISKAWISLSLRDFGLISQLISKSEELLDIIPIKPQSEFAKRDALLKLIKSNLYAYKDHNIDKAIEFGEESLNISEQNNNQKEIALALQNNSTYYFITGDLDQVLKHLERCLNIQRTYRKQDDWRTLKDLGVLNGMIGKLDLALDYTKQGLALAEELGNKSYIAQCLNNASLIYRQKGNLDQAKEALEQNLRIWEELDNKLKLIAGLDSLFVVSLDNNSLKQAEQYLLRMQQINEQIKDKISDVACRVNDALLLKMSSNSLDKEKAREILQEIVEEEIVNWEFTERALLHLCEIFLFELKTSSNQELLSKINPLISRLSEFAESQHSFRLLAEINLLQGKLAIIRMNMGDASQFFTKAERIADEHGLHLLARTISTEHDNLLKQIEKWEDFRKANTPISERFKYVEIDKTLDHMMGKKMMEPPDLVEEDPILLIIMSKAGNTFFNHTFIKNWDHSDFFSSFISAFNTYSSEIFAKSIDRIKIGENLISIKLIEPFLACYVSKGQSYPAIKKLNRFSDFLKNKKEVWEILNNAANTNRELNISSSPLLEDIVYQIFGVLSV
ncbi:MAG: hypothetical protein ACFE8B_16330 [Candidatus Hermodarchaeota archaeon]